MSLRLPSLSILQTFHILPHNLSFQTSIFFTSSSKKKNKNKTQRFNFLASFENPKCTHSPIMNSKTTHFLEQAESLPSLWIQDSSCSSMEGGKKRRLTVDQVRFLERNFNAEKKLEHERKVQIAEEIGLRPRQVAVWFQNRRARSKNKKIENDYDSLNAEYEQLKNDFDTLLNLNQELKAEVDQLREKCAANEKMKKPFEPVVEVEAMDSSVTELGKSNTNTKVEDLYKTQMGSSRQEEGSRSSSKSDVFYSESPTRENQSQSNNFLQDEEDELGYLRKLEEKICADELIDSFNIISNSVEDQSFCFWSSLLT